MELIRSSNGNSINLIQNSENKKKNNDELHLNDQKFYENLFEDVPKWPTGNDKISEPLAVPFNPVLPEVISVGVGVTSHTSSSSSNSSVGSAIPIGALCGKCDMHASSNRCLDCNDLLCDSCTIAHRKHFTTNEHCVVNLHASPTISAHVYDPNAHEPSCEIHQEALRYLCEHCKKVVCQECTLWEHRDHIYVPLKNAVEGAKEKIVAIIESGKLGTKYIKQGIDRAVSQSQAIERDSNEVCIKIKKAMRHFILAAEDRERVLIERVEKYRMQKLAILADQMAGLRSALSSLSQTSDNLAKALDMLNSMTPLEVAITLSKGESQMEQYAAMYKSLQPKEEFLTFVPPNFELLQDIRLQGELLTTGQRSTAVTPVNVPSAASMNVAPIRRPSIRNVQSNIPVWDSTHNTGVTGISSAINLSLNAVGQAIAGSQFHVVVKPALGPSLTFGQDGHEDGQVSRPWGVTTDKDGNIIIADRRNNRIQVFNSDGLFKLKFGQKGTGNGQFDLPAGISTDPQNRIIVVDKDNHRVQVFNAVGTFVKKFGSFGKDCGQFQYPWDVAVNSKGEMLITDSRNHRLQLFNQDGQFISRFTFDGINHSRYLKGFTTPRGVCFTPLGDIIVSDFENHRLLLIDSTLTKIKAVKGHEGSNTHEFSRPSGVCCDDDGKIIVADSKNQRVLIFSPQLEFLWALEIKPSSNSASTVGLEDKDRPSDVALLPDGRLVIMVETSPDARDQCSPYKTFIQIY